MKTQLPWALRTLPIHSLETNLAQSHQSSPNKERQGKAVTPSKGQGVWFILKCKGLISGLCNGKLGKIEGGEGSQGTQKYLEFKAGGTTGV